MKLRTRLRHCLYLNWAVPRSSLPDLPRGLTPEVHEHAGEELVFVTAVLFRQLADGPGILRSLRFEHPQMNLCVAVLDREGLPALWIHQLWMPPLSALGTRWLTGCSVRWARLDFTCGRLVEPDEWRWRGRARGRIDVGARIGSPVCGPGPALGGFQATVRYFRDRQRGYLAGAKGVERIETETERRDAVPVAVELREIGMLERALPLPDGWPGLHSAWVCPELAVRFAFGREPVDRRAVEARAATPV